MLLMSSQLHRSYLKKKNRSNFKKNIIVITFEITWVQNEK